MVAGPGSPCGPGGPYYPIGPAVANSDIIALSSVSWAVVNPWAISEDFRDSSGIWSLWIDSSAEVFLVVPLIRAGSASVDAEGVGVDSR